jgi:hypothetical protein
MLKSKKVKKLLKSKTLEYFILSSILISAFLVRLYKIHSPLADWHAWRQVDTSSVSQNLLKRNFDVLHPTYHDISSIQTGYFNPKGYRFVEFPFFNLLHAQLSLVLPNISFETSGRLVSILSSLVATITLYFLGKNLMGKWGGLLAAFFYSFIPFNIYFTRTILPDTLATTLSILSVYLFLLYTQNKKLLPLFFSSISFSLAMLVKPFALFYAVPILLLAFKNLSSSPLKLLKNKALLFCLLFALIPFLFWRIWLNQKDFFVGIAHISWAFNGDHIRFKPSFWKWIFIERIGSLILGTWGIFPFAMGVISQKKDQTINFILLGSLLYVTIIATANVRHDYYQTFIIPGIALALAQGSLSISKIKHALAKPALVFSIFLMLLSGVYLTRGNYNINHPEIITAGKAADELLPPNALIVAPYNGDTTFLYQTKHAGWPVVNESIEEIIKKGATHFVSVNFDDDTNRFMQSFKILKKTDQYVILDLTQKVSN